MEDREARNRIQCVVDEGIVLDHRDMARILRDLGHVRYEHWQDGKLRMAGEGMVCNVVANPTASTIVVNRRLYINVNGFSHMQLTILGNGSGGPFLGRHYTAQILQMDNQLFLIDCGEGTQMQMHRYGVRYDRLRQIFISHLHGDHVFGLVGLLTSWSLKKRTEPLAVFSPPGLEELVIERRRCDWRSGLLGADPERGDQQTREEKEQTHQIKPPDTSERYVLPLQLRADADNPALDGAGRLLIRRGAEVRAAHGERGI